jgi:hypothetical protein
MIWKGRRTIPCVKHTSKGLTLDALFSNRTGINGSFAPLVSHSTNAANITRPETRMPITLGEFQGNTTPPKSRLKRTRTVMLMIAAVPIQSICEYPPTLEARTFVASSRRQSMTKAAKQQGRLIQKTQRHERNSVNTPPRSGPSPAAKAQTRPVVAKNMPRWLSLVSENGLYDQTWGETYRALHMSLMEMFTRTMIPPAPIP